MPEAQRMSAGEVATRLGVHRATVHRIPAEDLGYVETGRRRARRYLRADVEAYADRMAAVIGTESVAERIRVCETRLDEHTGRIETLEAGMRGQPE